jgi:cysteine desulfurase
MEIYLDANATTPVLAQARSAALAAMAEDFGNPSSMHSTGLQARALMDAVRARARRVLGAPGGQLLFVSGATEGIQTAVLSALSALRGARSGGADGPKYLLYGATEHKAVPEALKHWNALLGLDLQVLAIPVGRDGRHDLAWLRAHAPQAGLVCTMAANNETGVISDLDGIEAALADSPARWMVDSVQALGKLSLNLAGRRIDYAPFSGHKLYAPKGIGLLYVREGAPFMPLMAGGGQEGALRSGTENMSGIAALGAVLAALEEGGTFGDEACLARYRERLADALQDAFPGLVFNAAPALCLPTTLNFSVPGLSSKLLLDLFDAADVRVSGGSACSAAKAQPSYVLEAMGLPAWQTASAVRLSFGPACDAGFIDQACARLRACGDALRQSCLGSAPSGQAIAADGLSRFLVDGACCYVLSDAASRRCVVIDPLPGLTERLAQLLNCQGHTLAAVLATRVGPETTALAAALRAALAAPLRPVGEIDALGWPQGADEITLGVQRLTRLPLAGEAGAYLLHEAGQGLRLAWVGELLRRQGDPALGQLAQAVGPHTLLLPGRDEDARFASTLAIEMRLEGAAPTQDPTPAGENARPELDGAALRRLLQAHPDLRLVDVRESYEQRLSEAPALGLAVRQQAVPLSALPGALPDWLALPAGTPLLFFCRSGNRSAQAARALRRLGRSQAWSLAGGLALWPRT